MIICCGEALVDMIPADTKGGQIGFVPHTGGSVFNTAIALGRLGVDAGMVSGVSTDRFGVLLSDTLAENGVATDLLIRSERLTTLAIVHLVDGHATYAFYDEQSAGRMIMSSDLPDIPPSAQAMFFGGISLVAEPGADAYAALLAREAAEKVIMLDPNIRPSFITDEARFRARLEGMISNSDIVKLSDEDLAWWTGGSEGIAEQAAQVRAAGPEIVLITRGSDGVTALCAGGDITVVAEPAQVVDTVGAGDTFNAGFLAGLKKDDLLDKTKLRGIAPEALRTALSIGNRAAAVTVSRVGANPPFASEIGFSS